MAIKGLSQEVSDAISFDPFEAIADEKGDGDRGQDETRASKPAARNESEKRFDKDADEGRDPGTGRFVPKTERDVSSAGGKQQQGSKPSAAAPAVGKSKPDEAKGESDQNPVQKFLDNLQQNPAAAMLFAGGTQPAPAQVPATPVQEQPRQRPGYDYSKAYSPREINLPPQLMEAIFNEDRNVAAQGMQVLISTMYNNLAADMHNRVAHVMQTLPQQMMAAGEIQAGQRELRTKFYGKHPDLNTPIGKQAVFTLSQRVAQMYSNMGQEVDVLSDDFIDYVAGQARQMLGMAGTPVLAKPEPRRQFQSSGGSRQGIDSSGDPFMDAIGMAPHGGVQ